MLYTISLFSSLHFCFLPFHFCLLLFPLVVPTSLFPLQASFFLYSACYHLPNPLPSCFLSSPPLIHIQSPQLAPLLLEPTKNVRQMLWINREPRLSISPQLAPSSRVPSSHQESSSPDQSGQ